MWTIYFFYKSIFSEFLDVIGKLEHNSILEVSIQSFSVDTVKKLIDILKFKNLYHFEECKLEDLFSTFLAMYKFKIVNFSHCFCNGSELGDVSNGPYKCCVFERNKSKLQRYLYQYKEIWSVCVSGYVQNSVQCR